MLLHAYSFRPWNRSRCDGNRGAAENCNRVSGHGFSANGYEWNMSSIGVHDLCVSIQQSQSLMVSDVGLLVFCDNYDCIDLNCM